MNKIIEWYSTYELEDGIENLLKARKALSIECHEVSIQAAKAELQHKSTYHARKISEAQRFLEADGTAAERSAKSIDEHIRLKEAKAEGELRGMKLMLDSYFKVLDSMASQINTLNR